MRKYAVPVILAVVVLALVGHVAWQARHQKPVPHHRLPKANVVCIYPANSQALSEPRDMRRKRKEKADEQAARWAEADRRAKEGKPLVVRR